MTDTHKIRADDAVVADAPLTVRVPTLLLDGEQPRQGVLARYATVRVVADTVVVRGHYRLPGAKLTMVARHVVSDNGTLDVTGHAGLSFDPAMADPTLDGRPDAPDGKPGAPGGHGEDGGTITLFAGDVQGELALVADGGRGGDGQRGGNGAKPATVNGRDGKFTSTDPPKGVYGAKTIQAKGLRSYVTMATGERGGDARAGGNAGPGGRPGDGGDGGHIVLHVLTPAAVAIRCRVEPGSAGAAAPAATPGPPGDPGVGGRNRVYLYNWFKGFGNEDWADGKNQHIKDWKLAARAASGKASSKSGSVPPAPTADPGQPGSVEELAAGWAETAAAWAVDDLKWLYEECAQGRGQSDATTGQARLAWLARLTEGAADAEIARLHALAEQALAAP